MKSRCSEMIRVFDGAESSQVLVPAFTLRGGEGAVSDDFLRITSKSISGVKPKVMPSSSSILVQSFRRYSRVTYSILLMLQAFVGVIPFRYFRSGVVSQLRKIKCS